MCKASLIKKYDRPVPRYTSYPTAIHFNHDISQQYYQNLLRNLNYQEPVSLYVHIPFCHVLCHYCGCHTRVVNNYNPVEAYVQTMLKEIDLVGKTLIQKLPVSQIHFGGGSPNFLKEKEFEKILEKINQYFDINNMTEMAIETDPRLLNKEKIETLAKVGFKRVSLGVQDFNPDVQKAVNRIQSFEEVKKAVHNLQEVGITKINFDLMIGLPLQTLDIVKDNLDKALSLKPNRFAIFAYAHVPWMKKHQKLLEKFPFPDSDLRFLMMKLVKQKMKQEKYHKIGIDHFSREDDSLYLAYKQKRLRRNFQGYTDDPAKTILAFGLSSISTFEGAYVQNLTDAPKYRKTVEDGKFPIRKGCVLKEEDKIRRDLIEQIMCGYKVNIEKYSIERQGLNELQQDGLIHIDNSSLQITKEGWPFARIIASKFDTYYEQQEKQHARAI